MPRGANADTMHEPPPALCTLSSDDLFRQSSESSPRKNPMKIVNRSRKRCPLKAAGVQTILTGYSVPFGYSKLERFSDGGKYKVTRRCLYNDG